MRDDEGYDSVRGDWLADVSRALGVQRPPTVVLVLIVGGLAGFVLEAVTDFDTPGFGYVFGGSLIIRGLLLWRDAAGTTRWPWLLPSVMVLAAAVTMTLLLGPLGGLLAGVAAALVQWWRFGQHAG